MADTYDVTGQRRTTVVGPDGNVSYAVEIDFTTKPNGVASSITVPADSYTVEAVKPMLEAAAANIEGIHAL